MKFMVSWSIPQDKWLPILNKFISMSPQEQTNAGEEVKMIGRWHDFAARTGVVIFESANVAAVSRYLGQWSPYCDMEIAPVFDDEEATVVARQIVADNKA